MIRVVKFKKLYIIFFVLVVFIQNTFSASISGGVFYKNGTPVKSLKILCESSSDTFVAYTDAYGKYRFILSDIIYAKYKIFIITPKGKKLKVGVLLIRKAHRTFDIKLTINKFSEIE